MSLKLMRGDKFEWSDKYSVGIAILDEQHKTLFDIIDVLCQGIIENNDEESMKEALHSLVAYIISHFEQEERMMSANHYPGYAEQVMEHRKLMDRVFEFAQYQLEDGIPPNLELTSFLINWLSVHIAEKDKAFGDFMNFHGMRRSELTG